MSEPRPTLRDRLLGAAVHAGHRAPIPVLVVLVLVTAAGLFFGSQLEVQTSRFDMVSPQHHYQGRMFRFFERFGLPDSHLILVRGEDPAARRRAVDAFMDQVEADGTFADLAFAKVDPATVAEVAILQRPEILTDLRASLPAGTDVGAALGDGLPGMLGLIETQLLAGLDGEVEVADEELEQGLDRLAKLADALRERLDPDAASGETVFDDWIDDEARPHDEGVDEEGYLVGRKGKHHLVLVPPSVDDTEIDDYRADVQRVRTLLDATRSQLAEEGDADVELMLTGMPALDTLQSDLVQEGMVRSSIAVSVGIFFVLLAAFRSLRHTIVAVVPIGVGAAMGLGIAYFTFGRVNAITSNFMAVLLGLGIDFSVHLLARYDESLRGGASKLQALYEAARRAGPGIVTGGVTTALAFLMLYGSEFTAYGELGVITSLGLVMTFMVTMVCIPCVLARGDADAPGKPAPPPWGITRLPKLMRVAPWVVIVVAVGGAVGGALAYPKLEFNTRYFDFLPPGEEASAAVTLLEEDGAMSPMLAFTSASDVEGARVMADELRGLSTVGEVHTVSDVLPPLDEARRKALAAGFAGQSTPDFEALAARKLEPKAVQGPVKKVVDALDEVVFALEQGGKSTSAGVAARDAFKRLDERLGAQAAGPNEALMAVEHELADVVGRAWSVAQAVEGRGHYVAADAPTSFRTRHFARDGSGAVALFVYPAGNIYDRDVAAEFAAQMESVDPEAAGHAMSTHYHATMILGDFRKAALLTAGLVVIVLILDLRRLVDTLLAMAPVVVGWCWTVGILVLFDIRLDVANVVVLPLVLGIGLDAGVHMLHRARQSEVANGGVGNLDDLVSGTGGAVLVASVTTMVGFAGLTVTRFGGMIGLGTMMIIGIGSCLLGAVLVLPALLLVLRRAR